MPTPLQAMVHRLATPEGRQAYALRKQTPKPVFGIIKAVMTPSRRNAFIRQYADLRPADCSAAAATGSQLWIVRPSCLG